MDIFWNSPILQMIQRTVKFIIESKRINKQTNKQKIKKQTGNGKKLPVKKRERIKMKLS